MKVIKENQTLNEIILHLLQETESKNYTYKSIASKCHMSLSTFYRTIKMKTGYTPANFINYLKVQRACQILESIHHKNLKLRDLAFELNYTDATYFSRVFKKYIGISPKIYRELSQKGLIGNQYPVKVIDFQKNKIKN